MGLAPLALDDGPSRQVGGQRRCGGLGGVQLLERAVGLGAGGDPAGFRGAESSGGLVPAGVGARKQSGSELVADRRASRLLLGLGGQPASLWPQLGDDVLDAGEVRRRLGQLVLGLAAATLVAPDAGDLLEQRAALLGPHGQRLVDHALADEQEGVVGEVGGVEEVDEVAQPDALLVQQVFVLAGAIQPPPELQDLEVDRQQAVAVVDDEGHVGHALRRALLRAGPDHVLGLARAERAALLAERPAERVGEVALAAAVRADDRADPAAELDVRALGERLEAVQAKGEQPRRRRPGAVAVAAVTLVVPVALVGHAILPGGRSCSIASAAAAVSATRRDGPSPEPIISPSTQTSIRNDFS